MTSNILPVKITQEKNYTQTQKDEVTSLRIDLHNNIAGEVTISNKLFCF